MPRPSGTSTTPRATQASGDWRGSAAPRKRTVAGIGDEAHDGAHQRALARAIGTEHGHELAVRDRQADVVQRLDAPVARRELPDLENGRHFTTMTCPPMMLASRNGLTVMP